MIKLLPISIFIPDGDHDIPFFLFRFREAVGFNHFFKGENPVDDRFDLSGCNKVKDEI